MLTLVHSFETASGIHCLALTKDDVALTGSRDHNITVWDIPNRSKLRSFQAHHRYFSSLAFTGEGKCAVIGSTHHLKVWDLQEESLVKEIDTLVDNTNILLMAPNGLCISGHEYGGILIWDLHSGKRVKTLERIEVWTYSRIMAEPDAITAAAITPDGKKLIAGTYYGFLYVWDLDSYAETHMFFGHMGYITDIALLPGGEQGISTAFDGTVKTWRLGKDTTAETLFEGKDMVCMAVVLPDGKRAVWGTDKGWLWVWDLQRGRILEKRSAHDGPINDAAVMSNGLLLTVSEDKTLKVWDLG